MNTECSGFLSSAPHGATPQRLDLKPENLTLRINSAAVILIEGACHPVQRHGSFLYFYQLLKNTCQQYPIMSQGSLVACILRNTSSLVCRCDNCLQLRDFSQCRTSKALAADFRMCTLQKNGTQRGFSIWWNESMIGVFYSSPGHICTLAAQMFGPLVSLYATKSTKGNVLMCNGIMILEFD